MGTCASCLGERRQSIDQQDDETRLLFDDPSQIHYGSITTTQPVNEEDPQEAQREAEVLQRIVALTSNSLVDVFDVAPQQSPKLEGLAKHTNGHDASLDEVPSRMSEASSETAVPMRSAEWQETGQKTSKVSLVGNFKQAAAAMT